MFFASTGGNLCSQVYLRSFADGFFATGGFRVTEIKVDGFGDGAEVGESLYSGGGFADLSRGELEGACSSFGFLADNWWRGGLVTSGLTEDPFAGLFYCVEASLLRVSPGEGRSEANAVGVPIEVD